MVRGLPLLDLSNFGMEPCLHHTGLGIRIISRLIIC